MDTPHYRPLDRSELDTLIDWAADEGWNPGLQDADIFWATDPEAFVGIEQGGELIGGGAIVSYGGVAGFMGLFIVRKDRRGMGLGRDFWIYRRDRLRERLAPDAWIAMDGVFGMQPFYAQGGFVFSHRNLRMEGVGRRAGTGGGAADVVDLARVGFEDVAAYDRRHFLAPRTAFLERWIAPEGGRALGCVSDGALCGYGVVRPCRTGFKIGPLFADSPEIAGSLLEGLSVHAAGVPLFLDVPENNPDAMALAECHGMREVFGCARMVLGPVPAIPWRRIYGVTTFGTGA